MTLTFPGELDNWQVPLTSSKGSPDPILLTLSASSVIAQQKAQCLGERDIIDLFQIFTGPGE